MTRQKALFGKLTFFFMSRKSAISADLPGFHRAYYPGWSPGRINFNAARGLIAKRGLIAAERRLIVGCKSEARAERPHAAGGGRGDEVTERDANILYAYVNMLIGIFDSQIGIFVH